MIKTEKQILIDSSLRRCRVCPHLFDRSGNFHNDLLHSPILSHLITKSHKINVFPFLLSFLYDFKNHQLDLTTMKNSPALQGCQNTRSINIA